MNTITTAFAKHAKKPKINSKPTMWWTDECNTLKDNYARSPSKITRKEYYKAIRKAKKEYFGKKIEEMCEQNKPWEGVRWTRDRPLSNIPRFANSEGNSITTTEELWPILDKQFNSGKNRKTNINWNMINDLPQHPTRTWQTISNFKVKEAIRTTSNSSAPGYSNITWRHLKILLREDEFLLPITTLFNNILSEGRWPSEFKIANTVVIPKPKREDYTKPKSFRPIALLDCIGKLLSKVLAARLQDEALKFDLLHPLQFGGIKQRSTTDAGIVLTEFIKKARDAGQFTSCLAIDMAQYFPSLNHEVLKIMLKKLGFTNNITNLFSSYFNDRVTVYLWGNQESSQFSASDGVPQGDPLSPILSDLYVEPKNIWRYLGFFFDPYLDFNTHIQRYINKAFSALNAMRMLGNSIEGFTPSKRKLAFTACVWSIATYGAVLWYKKNGKGIKQKANKLNKVKNTGMHWISGAFSTTPISALELITYTPLILAQLNITAFKYALRINKLSPIHPCRCLARTFLFQNLHSQRIRIKPGPYEKFSVFNMCRDPNLVTDERFVYNHKEQIFGKRILDLFDSNIKFVNFDHPKKGTDLFVQWFEKLQSMVEHYSFKETIGTAAYALWANQVLIHSAASQVSAHSAYDAEIQAIQLVFEQLKLLPFKKVTLLIDNEAAARSIWRTDYHNLQWVSIKAMTHFREWTTHLKTKDFLLNVLWCPAHMDVQENELVDTMASEVIISDLDSKTTLESEIKRIQKLEFDEWNKTTRKHNGLGSEYLRLKFKGRRIGPSLGSRRKAFIQASNDNINMMARLTRLITNHAPTGEYRRRFFPNETTNCNYDNEYQSRVHILTKCDGYHEKFKNMEHLRKDKDELEKVVKFLETNIKAGTFGDAPKGIG
ncbi:hypothetical protein AX15_007303 [Amanita polypyramis BW_CC]|nr:hypothetical protein AX15_007303 [Amanita polypyramis BW_CC]